MKEKTQETVENTKQKKKGCLRGLIVLIVLALLVVFVISWLGNVSALVPDREEQAEAGLIADDDKLFVLLAGSDKTQALDTSRADTIILACVDTAESWVYLLSLPRDSYVEIEGHGMDKINHAYSYGGMELLEDTVSNLLNVPIDYYAMVDFAGFEDIIDALGGVDIDVDKRMYYQTYDTLIDIPAGLQHLDGEKALQYVRFRADELGDITRVSRQQNLLKAVYTQFTENQGYLKLPQLIPAVAKAVETNMSTADMIRLALFIKGMDAEDISSSTLEGSFLDLNGISYWQVDDAAVEQLQKEVFGDNGDD